VARFRGTIRQRAFHGATELLQVECSDGFLVSVRAPAREYAHGYIELEFSAADAVGVQESPERN
jgi:hypothetical protein